MADNVHDFASYIKNITVSDVKKLQEQVEVIRQPRYTPELSAILEKYQAKEKKVNEGKVPEKPSTDGEEEQIKKLTEDEEAPAPTPATDTAIAPEAEAEEKMPGTFEVTDEVVDQLAKDLNINFEEVNRGEFKKGLQVEQEHISSITGEGGVSDPIITTGKLVLDHLKELPDFYTREEQMIADAKEEGTGEEGGETGPATPAVADTAENPIPAEESKGDKTGKKCPKCAGEGQTPDKKTCDRCKGSGLVDESKVNEEEGMAAGGDEKASEERSFDIREMIAHEIYGGLEKAYSSAKAKYTDMTDNEFYNAGSEAMESAMLHAEFLDLQFPSESVQEKKYKEIKKGKEKKVNEEAVAVGMSAPATLGTEEKIKIIAVLADKALADKIAQEQKGEVRPAADNPKLFQVVVKEGTEPEKKEEREDEVEEDVKKVVEHYKTKESWNADREKWDESFCKLVDEKFSLMEASLEAVKAKIRFMAKQPEFNKHGIYLAVSGETNLGKAELNKLIDDIVADVKKEDKK
jgi:hypothetical protein